MSKAYAAKKAAPATKEPVKVASREVLASGFIVKVKVPERATWGRYPAEDGVKKYLRFEHTVAGGLVNVFVHTDKDLRGSKIVAEAVVIKKTFESNLEYLHVDLIPTLPGVGVTHRMAIMSRLNRGSAMASPNVFETPDPLRGSILFVPPDTKIV